PLIETFGVAVPVAQFASYAAGAGDDVARFCDRALGGRASMLFEPSPSLPDVLEHGIRRMLEARYEGALEELYLLSQSIELLVRVLEGGSRVSSGAGKFTPSKVDRDKLVAA